VRYTSLGGQALSGSQYGQCAAAQKYNADSLTGIRPPCARLLPRSLRYPSPAAEMARLVAVRLRCSLFSDYRKHRGAGAWPIR
jgi:hypothetical protein